MTNSVNLIMDGREISARQGLTILEAAQEVGIEIPTLCYHKDLNPFGACNLCSVEIQQNGSSRIVASCAYPVEPGLRVKTRSPKIDKIRRMLIEVVAPRVSQGGTLRGRLRRLADEYGANSSRFASKSTAEPLECILCGLCVRYCAEVKKMNAIGFVGRGIDRQVVLYPAKAQQCYQCKACYKVCPTGKIAVSMPKVAGDFPSEFCVDAYLSTHGTKLHKLSSLEQI